MQEVTDRAALQLRMVARRLRALLRSRRGMAAMLFLAFLGLYLTFPTHSAYFTRDPLHTAQAIETKPLDQLFQPHHLAYDLTGWLAYRVGTAMGVEGALIPLQTLSILAGALGLALFYLLIDSIVQDGLISLLCSLLLGFSYGYWRYAVEAMPYPIAMALLVVAMYLALQIAQGAGKRTLFSLALVSVLATLYHQMSLFLLFVTAVAIWLRRDSGRQKAWLYLQYFAVVTLLVVVSYLLAIALLGQTVSLTNVVRYLTEYAHSLGDTLGVGRFTPLRSLKSLIGIGNLFVGEVFALRYIAANPGLARRFVSLTPGVALPPAAYAKQSTLIFVLMSSLVMVVGLLLGLLILYFVRRSKRIWHQNRRTLAICAAWLLPVSVFALWYFPENVHFWIPNLIPILVIVAVLLKDARQSAGGNLLSRGVISVATLLIPFLFAVNFFGSILPAHRPEANWYRQAALGIVQFTDSDDLLITLGSGEYKHVPPYVNYYVGTLSFPANAILFDAAERTRLETMIQRTWDAGNQVYVFGDVFSSEWGHLALSRLSGLSEEEVTTRITALFDGYRLDPIYDDGIHPALYELRPLYDRSAQGSD